MNDGVVNDCMFHNSQSDIAAHFWLGFRIEVHGISAFVNL